MKVETFFSSSSSSLFPLLSSPCVIPVLGLAHRPGRWFSASEWETPLHTVFLLKNRIINTAWTASSSRVGVPLTLQTCLDSRIPDQLITHAFLSLPRHTYRVENRHVRRRQHFYHKKKRVGEKKHRQMCLLHRHWFMWFDRWDSLTPQSNLVNLPWSTRHNPCGTLHNSACSASYTQRL